MPDKRFTLTALLLFSLALAVRGSSWEWHFAAGPWTLEPWASPAERQAENVVASEAERLLAPLLSELTVISFRPDVAMRSRGYFLAASCWRSIGDGRFAVGATLSYLRSVLPFSLRDERDIFFQGIPVARVETSGEGQIDLRTFMAAGLARWRFWRSGRFAAFAGLGMTVLRLNGGLHLPVRARIRTILGTVELSGIEDKSLAELRESNEDVPAWVPAPALTASLHYRLARSSRLFLEWTLSQGSSLALGYSVGN